MNADQGQQQGGNAGGGQEDYLDKGKESPYALYYPYPFHTSTLPSLSLSPPLPPPLLLPLSLSLGHHFAPRTYPDRKTTFASSFQSSHLG